MNNDRVEGRTVKETDPSKLEDALEDLKESLYGKLDTITRLSGEEEDLFRIDCDFWEDTPYPVRLRESDIGKKVWLSTEREGSTDVYLREYKNIGDKYYPYGGYILQRKGDKYSISAEYDEAVLHPDEITLTLDQVKQVQEFKREKKKASKSKYENPLTGRSCSYQYALKLGFIDEVGNTIPLEDMKFLNEETGRMVSYQYAKQKGII